MTGLLTRLYAQMVCVEVLDTRLVIAVDYLAAQLADGESLRIPLSALNSLLTSMFLMNYHM